MVSASSLLLKLKILIRSIAADNLTSQAVYTILLLKNKQFLSTTFLYYSKQELCVNRQTVKKNDAYGKQMLMQIVTQGKSSQVVQNSCKC